MLITKLYEPKFLLFILLWSNIFTITEADQTSLRKNISQILDSLLKEYRKSEHPNQHAGQPTIINTSMLINSIGPIRESDMSFTLDCYFRLRWIDPRLKFPSPLNKTHSLSAKMLEQIWIPDTHSYNNGENSYIHPIELPNKLLRLSGNGTLLYSKRLTIIVKCPMSSRNFWDAQCCPLIIGSYIYTAEQIRFDFHKYYNEDAVAYAPEIKSRSQLDLKISSYKNVIVSREEAEFSALQVSFNLVQNIGFVSLEKYVTGILIVIFSLMEIYIRREFNIVRGLGAAFVYFLIRCSLICNEKHVY